MNLSMFMNELAELLNDFRYKDTIWAPCHDSEVTTREEFLDRCGNLWDKSTKEGIHPTSFVTNEDVIIAITGMTNASKLHAELIAFLLNNASVILDELDSLSTYKRVNEKHKQEKQGDDKWRDEARDQYETDDVKIYDDAIVDDSPEDGVWVEARVWLPKEEIYDETGLPTTTWGLCDYCGVPIDADDECEIDGDLVKCQNCVDTAHEN